MDSGSYLTCAYFNSQGKAGPEDGVRVFGLYLDGARWSLETNTLQDTLPMQRCCRLPEVHFIPTMVR